jgi:heme exporter protein B
VKPLLQRELRLALRHKADTLSAVLFFVLVSALFPFGTGPSPELLSRLAPGALLAASLLAALLPLDRLFGADAEDGTLDQLLLSGLHPAAICATKALAHWLTTGVPLVLATPIAAALLNLPAEAWGAAILALALASAILSSSARQARRSPSAPAAAASCSPCWCCRSPSPP